MPKKMIRLKRLDMNKAVEHNHPDVDLRKSYLVRWSGQWFAGRFSRQWYGLNFEGWSHNPAGLQFDAPGYNSSEWEGIWEIQYT